jgi:signal transduction histidine kinase
MGNAVDVTAADRIAQRILDRQIAIIDAWRARVEVMPELSVLPPSGIVDHLPEFLKQLAARVSGHGGAGARSFRNLSEGHAVQRLGLKVDLGTLLTEYAILRETILAELEPVAQTAEDRAALIGVNRALDLAVLESVKRYTTHREELRDRFVAMLGHDLRGPLHAHVMAADAILRSACDQPIHQELAESLKRGAEHMSRMVFDLLDYARSQLGGLPTDLKTCDMGDLCKLVVDQARSLHPSRVIEVEVSGALLGSWDRDRVMQAIGNLVSNAFLHGADPVTVRAFEGDSGQVVITEVHNVGPEITPELISLVFDPYQRAHNEDGTTHTKGLGLGLYIVREIALAHGGECTVTSAVGNTTFRIEWPRVPLEDVPRPYQRMFEPACVSVDARIDPVAERIQPNRRPGKNVASARGSPSLGRWISANASADRTSASPTPPPRIRRFGGKRRSSRPSKKPRKNSSSGSATTTSCTAQNSASFAVMAGACRPASPP